MESKESGDTRQQTGETDSEKREERCRDRQTDGEKSGRESRATMEMLEEPSNVDLLLLRLRTTTG